MIAAHDPLLPKQTSLRRLLALLTQRKLRMVFT